MEVTGAHWPQCIQRLAIGTRGHRLGGGTWAHGAGHGLQRGVGDRPVEGVAPQRAEAVTTHTRHIQLLRPQSGQPVLHDHPPRQQAPHGVAGSGFVHQFVEQQHHAAAFCPHRFASGGMRTQGIAQGVVGAQGVGMQLGVATGQPDGIARGQHGIGQRREKHHLGPQGLQGVDVGLVDEAQGCIAGHGHGAATQIQFNSTLRMF